MALNRLVNLGTWRVWNCWSLCANFIGLEDISSEELKGIRMETLYCHGEIAWNRIVNLGTPESLKLLEFVSKFY